MHKIFTGLENAFAGPGWVWKPHKSKDQIFLHRNYVQKISQRRKKIYFFSRSKKFRFFFSITKNHEKISRKISIFFQIPKFQNFKILKFWNLKKKRDFSGNFFVLFFGRKKFRKIFWSRKKVFFFSELRKIFGHSFDVKIYDLSIYEVFGTIWALQPDV